MTQDTDNAAAPLHGIKILDFTHGVAGPYGVMLLADLGAEVWKIEKPKRGDPTRYMNVSNRFAADIPTAGGDYFLAINRNKRSIGIDLQQAAGQDVALKLVRNADIVVSNFRPGVMGRLGLDYAACREVNPGIIYASLSAYGERGPLAHQPGMDVAVQARSGVMGITGNGAGGPVKPGASIADFSGGAHLDIAILAALHRRSNTGKGGELHVSLLDSMISMLSNYSVAVMDGGAEVAPMGSGHPQLVPFQAFPSQDGYIVIATGTNRLFGDLCEVLGLPQLAKDERFATNVVRVQNRDALIPLISEATSQRSTAEWLDIFEQNEIPCAPVNTLSQAFAEEQLTAQDMIVPSDHPTYGTIHLVGAPYTFGSARPGIARTPPLLGEHTAELLAGVITPDEIRTLAEDGVISRSEAPAGASSAR